MRRATIRVLVVDDQTLIREGLASLLMMQPDLDVVGKAADGRAAIELAAALRSLILRRRWLWALGLEFFQGSRPMLSTHTQCR